jgi:hypothetical protein
METEGYVELQKDDEKDHLESNDCPWITQTIETNGKDLGKKPNDAISQKLIELKLNEHRQNYENNWGGNGSKVFMTPIQICLEDCNFSHVKKNPHPSTAPPGHSQTETFNFFD